VLNAGVTVAVAATLPRARFIISPHVYNTPSFEITNPPFAAGEVEICPV
jgi:hypothetical protein